MGELAILVPLVVVLQVPRSRLVGGEEEFHVRVQPLQAALVAISSYPLRFEVRVVDLEQTWHENNSRRVEEL